MKKLFIIIASVLLSNLACGQQDTAAMQTQQEEAMDYSAAIATDENALWDQANTAYANAAYRQAITLYDSIAAGGKVSYKLYYNLANAYFKAGDIGKSILYYNKAKLLAPADNDIDYNLAVANSYVKDKIEQVPEFFIERWVRSLRMSLGCSSWTIISLGLLFAGFIAALFYLLSGRTSRRKSGFYGAIICAALFVAATIFASVARRQITHPDQAVVMGTAVSVKSAPDRQSKDLFVIHEGTKVTVVSTLQEWREVVIADGNKGWIEVASIEMI